LDVSAIHECLDLFVFELSDSDADLAQGYCLEDIEECVKIIDANWISIIAAVDSHVIDA